MLYACTVLFYDLALQGFVREEKSDEEKSDEMTKKSKTQFYKNFMLYIFIPALIDRMTELFEEEERRKVTKT